MAEEPPHPATTPKGASAITVLLGVVSVLAPFIFNVQTALLVSAVAVVVIAWIYWSEMRAAFAQRGWSSHLNVPVGAIVMILLMSGAAIRQGGHEPRPIPVPNADDIAGRVEARLVRDHLVPQAREPDHAAVVSTGSPFGPTRLVPRVKAPAPPTPSAPAANIDFRKITDAYSKAEEQLKPRQEAELQCITDSVRANQGLYKLDVEAVNAQNGWAITKDDKKVVDAYKAWVIEAHDLFEKYKKYLPDTSDFDKATDADPRPTFLLIHNAGVHAWNSFDAKRTVVESIAKIGSHNPCPGITAADYQAIVQKELKDGTF